MYERKELKINGSRSKRYDKVVGVNDDEIERFCTYNENLSISSEVT